MVSTVPNIIQTMGDRWGLHLKVTITTRALAHRWGTRSGTAMTMELAKEEEEGEVTWQCKIGIRIARRRRERERDC